MDLYEKEALFHWDADFRRNSAACPCCGGTLLLFRDRSGIPSEDILVNQQPPEAIAPAASIESLPSPSPADAPAESPNAKPEPVSEPHTLNQRLAEILGEDALSDPHGAGHVL